jgi:hypothetical protein
MDNSSDKNKNNRNKEIKEKESIAKDLQIIGYGEYGDRVSKIEQVIEVKEKVENEDVYTVKKISNISARQTEVICNFINESLSKNELCICISMNVKDEKWVSTFLAKKIKDYQNNVKESRLWLIDSSSIYIAALCHDFKFFEKFKEQIKQRLFFTHLTKVCLISDCAGFLFKNKHFEQCRALEQWWIKNLPKNVNRLSIYPGHLFDKSPYKYNINSILSDESISLILSY